jgi:two-component system nitrate/nitrite response regulator NarP
VTTVILADDHPIILSGVEGLLLGTDFQVVGSLRDGAAVLAAVRELNPDLLVIDYKMPEVTGLEVLRTLRQHGDRRPVVFLTATVDNEVVLQAYQLGLNGLVLKHAAPDLLLVCLEEVRGGGRWIDQMLLQRALSAALGEGAKKEPASNLSPREREIVTLVVAGDRNPDIAGRLGITPGTVKVHLHRIYEKLGVGSRAQLIVKARGFV